MADRSLVVAARQTFLGQGQTSVARSRCVVLRKRLHLNQCGSDTVAANTNRLGLARGPVELGSWCHAKCSVVDIRNDIGGFSGGFTFRFTKLQTSIRSGIVGKEGKRLRSGRTTKERTTKTSPAIASATRTRDGGVVFMDGFNYLPPPVGFGIGMVYFLNSTSPQSTDESSSLSFASGTRNSEGR